MKNLKMWVRKNAETWISYPRTFQYDEESEASWEMAMVDATFFAKIYTNAGFEVKILEENTLPPGKILG